MLKEPRHQKSRSTPYVLLDTSKCRACWKCFERCPNKVIGKINLPWHKHVRIVNAENCTGCQKCVQVCESEALSVYHENQQF